MDSVARFDAADRRDLFREAAARRGAITPEVVEKDFWVCWTLKRLFSLDPPPARLIFKGGTSLSKVYGVIERFSEDIDLSFHRQDLGFAHDTKAFSKLGKNKRYELIKSLKLTCRTLIREDLLPQLRSEFERLLGPQESPDRPWGVRLADDDADHQTINFSYPPAIVDAGGAPRNPYLRPYVRIELGARSDHWPDETRPIRPYAADEFPDAFESPESTVRTLSAERTFWEKATILHAAYHLPPEKNPQERHSRHYYDLARLFQSPIGEKALARLDLLEAVVEHKNLFFTEKKAHYESAVPGTFHIVPSAERLAAIEADYQAMREHMIFGESYEIRELMAVLSELEARINAG